MAASGRITANVYRLNRNFVPSEMQILRRPAASAGDEPEGTMALFAACHTPRLEGLRESSPHAFGCRVGAVLGAKFLEQMGYVFSDGVRA